MRLFRRLDPPQDYLRKNYPPHYILTTQLLAWRAVAINARIFKSP
jgi:hypothetical protein